MAWNTSHKRVQPTETKVVGPGGLVAHRVGTSGQPYKDGWDIERAYRDGVKKVTWVFRAIDAIASNQAKLPVELRSDNSPTGTLIKGKSPVLQLLNSATSKAENKFIFRYRLSAQTLTSSRGAFVEIIRGRGGIPIALHLLPPQTTSPIPDPKTFVSGFEVVLPGGKTEILKPQDVLWIRRPHPLDPYLSLTPMEAAGVAIEIENLAKLYNRNYLLNDGRPGGILLVQGEMEEDDENELKARFGGNLNKTGQITVLSGDGASFIDTSSTPRDAAYTQMREVTKEEILSAFGVPESVIGNASGRCLRASELVRLSSGRRVRAGDLVGETFKLWTSTPDGPVEAEAWATLERVEPIYRVTTESGRCLEVNGRHPLFAADYVPTRESGHRSDKGPKVTVREWTPIAELDVGDLVAVPTITTTYPTEHFTADEGFVLGALVGDGTMTGDGKPVMLSAQPGPFVKSFISCVENLGDQVVEMTNPDKVEAWRVRATPTNRIGSGRGARNSVRTRVLLREVGLMGTKSATKFIPEEIFASPDETLAAFLSGYFAADGHISIRTRPSKKAPGGVATISASTVSRRLALDVQEALLRFGVHARVSEKTTSPSTTLNIKGGSPCWTVTIARARSILAFAAHIPIPGKQEALNAAVAMSENKLARRSPSSWKSRNLNPGLEWEKITSIEEIGEDQTIGIAVPGHHTYLSTLWEHNTFSNAAEELRVFWMETMEPHLVLLEGGFDPLDPKNYIKFDTTGVPILILAKQEREQHNINEWQQGLITVNEYREGTGREPVRGDLGNSLFISPQTTPFANTEIDLEIDPKVGATTPVAALSAPQQDPSAPPGTPLNQDAEAEPAGDPEPEEERSLDGPIEYKAWEIESKANIDRWTVILELGIKRLLERQKRVVSEKAGGKRARKAMESGTLGIDDVFDTKVWQNQAMEDLKPILAGAAADGADLAASRWSIEVPRVNGTVDQQAIKVSESVCSLREQLESVVTKAQGFEGDINERVVFLKIALEAVYDDAINDGAAVLARANATKAYEAGQELVHIDFSNYQENT